jgi:phospholipid/cholesterol/gamma-HCH transport system substrate-binding protein/paraquat-inducible protein B
MSTKANYFKIGAFILSALAIAVITIVVLSGGRWFRKNMVYWESYFDESVQGLAVGAPIKYRGVQVGTVDTIDFVDNEYGSALSKDDLVRYGRYVVVTGSARRITPHLTQEEQKAAYASNIVGGLRVRLASLGVTGVVYLEADYLDPHEYPVMNIPWKPQLEYVPSAPSTVTVLGAALHNIARNLEKTDIHTITSDLDTLLLDVTKLVKEANLQHLSHQAGQMLTEFQETAQQARRLVESPEFKTVISHAAGSVEGTRHLVADLSQASQHIKIASETLPDTFTQLERTVHRIDRLVSNKSREFEETVENLRVMSENVRELTDNAKRYPAQVLFGDPPPRAGSTKR